MPTGHTPNADHATYLRHFESALDEWLRTGVVNLFRDLRTLIVDAIDHPSPEDLKAASEQSQDGSIAYHFNPGDGSVTVSPAIPHTEETAAAVNEAGGHAVPATTSTATAGSEQLADTSQTEGASPENPEGGAGTGVLSETQVSGAAGTGASPGEQQTGPSDEVGAGAEGGILDESEAAALQTDQHQT